MRFAAIATLLAVLLASPAAAQSGPAQSAPRFELFAGYSFVQPISTRPLGDETSGHGMDLAFTWWASRMVGLEVRAKGRTGLMIGPNFAWPVSGRIQPFVHVLFLPQVSSSLMYGRQWQVNLAAGGGATLRLGTRFSWRIVEFDYLNLAGQNVRPQRVSFSSGLVVRFGAKTPSRSAK